MGTLIFMVILPRMTHKNEGIHQKNKNFLLRQIQSSQKLHVENILVEDYEENKLSSAQSKLKEAQFSWN